MNSITIRRPDDMHCHFRRGDLLQEVLPQTARCFGRGIAMPNTRPRAILTADDVKDYRNEIEREMLHLPTSCQAFRPLMTIEIRDDTTPDMVRAAHAAGAVAGKVYPRGVTTNSDEGLKDIADNDDIYETFEAMQEAGMLLLLHGEVDNIEGEEVLVTEREEAFLNVVPCLAAWFPQLKIVLEHVSTARGVELVKNLGDNVAATITAHHLYLTLNDVLGRGIRPHNMCMPVPKGFTDRAMLRAAVLSGSPKFFLGSDTAPHTKENKECECGACGVYTAPVLLEVLAQFFESVNSLHLLENFTSRFGAEFYGLPLNEGTITLTKEDWVVPKQIGSVVPFKAGETLHWKLKE